VDNLLGIILFFGEIIKRALSTAPHRPQAEMPGDCMATNHALQQIIN